MVVTHLADTGGLRPGLQPDLARDIVWVLNSPEVYQQFATDRGWQPHEYQQWLAHTIAHALLANPDPP
jgi:hypothetical protein